MQGEGGVFLVGLDGQRVALGKIPDDSFAARIGVERFQPVGRPGHTGEAFHDAPELIGVVAPSRDGCLDEVVSEPLLPKLDLEPAKNEVEGIRKLFRRGFDGEQARGLLQPLPEGEVTPVADQIGQEPQRVAPQTVWIGRSPGFDADREEAGQTVEPVGDGNGEAGRRLRQRVARETRAVVLLYGGGDALGLPGGEGVVSPHGPLQRGHLDDHAGGQVGFGERCGPESRFPLCIVQAQIRRESGDQTLDPLALLQHGAQALLVGQRVQPPEMILQGRLAVVSIEVGRIGVARADNGLVAPHDPVGIGGSAVGNGDEIGQNPIALCLQDGEVPLVFPHHGDEDFLRQLQVGLVEGSQKRLGGFDQVGHLVQQPGIIGHPSADFGSYLAYSIANHLAPLIPVYDQARVRHCGEEVFRCRKLVGP